MSASDVRRLAVEEAAAYRAIRLASLRHAPESFGTLHAEEAARPFQHFVDTFARAEVFGAFADGQLVGVARLHPGTGTKERHKGSINGVFVMPEHRGRGLARAVMTALIDSARPSLEQLTLNVVASNEAAIRLYETLGFRRCGLEPRARKYDGVYTDTLMMVLPLNPVRIPAGRECWGGG